MPIYGQMSANNALYNAVNNSTKTISPTEEGSSVDWGGIINSGLGALNDVYDNYLSAQMQAAGMANAASAAAQQQQYAMNNDLMQQQYAMSYDLMQQQYAMNTEAMLQQMAFNASSAKEANALQYQLQKEAMEYNSTESQKQRDWLKSMSNTAYQRAVADMRKAGINPILAATNGGANVGSGAAASISSAKSAQASGVGTGGSSLGGVSGTSVGNYAGQGYHLSDTFATFGAILGTVGNIMSALQANGGFNNAIKTVGDAVRYADQKITEKRQNYIKNSKNPYYSQIKANNYYISKDYAKKYGIPSIKA